MALGLERELDGLFADVLFDSIEEVINAQD